MSTTSIVARARPPVVPRVAMLRMNTPGSFTRSVIRMRSPRIEPPEYGLEGSTAMMPTFEPAARKRSASADTSVDFPLPGTPVSPMTCARPARR
jgi:hypothetical protein